MKYLVLDFETKDPYLSPEINLGPGWVYSLHVPDSLFKILGYSYCFIIDDTIGPVEYITNTTHLISLLHEADAVIMHNAQYDLGCLRALHLDIKHLTVYDTKIMAYLANSTRKSYSLDSLSELYLGEHKHQNRLIETAIKSGKGPKINPEAKTFPERMLKWAYTNMDIIQEVDFNAMADYAIQDSLLTARLFLRLTREVSLEQSEFFSSYQVICTKLREKGIRVDMNKLQQGMIQIRPQVKSLLEQVYQVIPSTVNLDSPKQLSEALRNLGYSLPQTENGNDSVNKQFLTDNPTDPFLSLLTKYRAANKIYNDFFERTLEMQKYTCPDALAGSGYGRVFPEMKVLGTATGRFSSAHPNIQQIPKHNEAYAALCRSMYVPDNDKNNWYSLDWSNQEGRLQVHYANLIKANGIDQIVSAFAHYPDLDIHQKIADMIGISRKQAKTINLGLSYGMGEGKLCRSLGLPTKNKSYIKHGNKINYIGAGKEGSDILDRYHSMFPYLKELSKRCENQIRQQNYLRSLLGRHIHREPGFDYKALNKLIQGSAADQCLAALKAADEEGLDIKCLVHDEFNIEGNELDALKMKHIMEHVVELTVPMRAEVNYGTNWGYLKPLKGKV